MKSAIAIACICFFSLASLGQNQDTRKPVSRDDLSVTAPGTKAEAKQEPVVENKLRRLGEQPAPSPPVQKPEATEPEAVPNRLRKLSEPVKD